MSDNIQLYNTKNQKLIADKLKDILSTISDDISIAYNISDSEPLENYLQIDNINHTWNINSDKGEIDFFAGGIAIACTDTSLHNFTGLNSIYGLDIVLPNNPYKVTISSTDYVYSQISEVICSSIEESASYFPVTPNVTDNPSSYGWFELVNNVYEQTTDTQVQADKDYYLYLPFNHYTILGMNFPEIIIDGVTVAESIQSLDADYHNTTLWVDKQETYKRFFIPICYKVGNNISSMLNFRDVNTYKSFLTIDTYNKLIGHLNGRFVWRIGGPEKGDIGELNITDDLISNTDDGSVKIKSPVFGNVNNISTVKDSGGSISKYICTISSPDDNGFAGVSRLVGPLPIELGGTSGDNKKDAKTNLGIYYDEKGKFPAIASEGDIFFEIIE